MAVHCFAICVLHFMADSEPAVSRRSSPIDNPDLDEVLDLKPPKVADSVASLSFVVHLDFDDRVLPQTDAAAHAVYYDTISKFRKVVIHGHINLCVIELLTDMTDFHTLAVEVFGSKCHNLELCSSDVDIVLVLVPGQKIAKWLNQLQIRHKHAHPTSFEPTPYAVFDIGCRIELGV